MVSMQWIAPDAIKPNARNARTHTKKQIRQIADSITAFGFLVPILVEDTWHGHCRRRPATKIDCPQGTSCRRVVGMGRA